VVYPWARYLPGYELKGFAFDLRDALLSEGPDVPKRMERVVIGWRGTAEVYADRDLQRGHGKGRRLRPGPRACCTVSPKRKDRVAPPAGPGEWEIRFYTSEAAKGWEVLCQQAAGNTAKAWHLIRADPRPPVVTGTSRSAVPLP
jgi:hypothetical protein